MPRPTTTSTTVAGTVSPTESRVQPDMTSMPAPGEQQPDPGDGPVPEPAQRPAAEQSPDRDGEEEAHEHQGGARLVVGVGEAGQERHVDDDRDERRADEEAHDERAQAAGARRPRAG